MADHENYSNGKDMLIIGVIVFMIFFHPLIVIFIAGFLWWLLFWNPKHRRK